MDSFSLAGDSLPLSHQGSQSRWSKLSKQRALWPRGEQWLLATPGNYENFLLCQLLSPHFPEAQLSGSRSHPISLSSSWAGHTAVTHSELCLLGASNAREGDNKQIRVDKLDDGVMTMKEVRGYD